MGLSEADKKNVQGTWNAVHSDWGAKNGEAFYTWMFSKQPEIKSKFTNPDLKLQSGKFGVMVQRWMEGLDNEDKLDSAMKEFCKRHTELGITDLRIFGVALTELKNFINSLNKLSDAQNKSWDDVAGAIIASMKKHFGQ